MLAGPKFCCGFNFIRPLLRGCRAPTFALSGFVGADQQAAACQSLGLRQECSDVKACGLAIVPSQVPLVGFDNPEGFGQAEAEAATGFSAGVERVAEEWQRFGGRRVARVEDIEDNGGVSGGRCVGAKSHDDLGGLRAGCNGFDGVPNEGLHQDPKLVRVDMGDHGVSRQLEFDRVSGVGQLSSQGRDVLGHKGHQVDALRSLGRRRGVVHEVGQHIERAKSLGVDCLQGLAALEIRLGGQQRLGSGCDVRQWIVDLVAGAVG